MAGLVLDPWQAFVLEHSLGEGKDARWAAKEVGLVVPRQNGKGAILEARELAGLFLLGERLIVHSAHQFDTSLEAFWRIKRLIEEHAEFSARVRRMVLSHGEEGIELKNGQRLRFRTRTKGGGRGFSGDCLIVDEAMILPEVAHAALFPTVSARPNSQVWYTGSTVDREVHEHGIVLSRIRKRGLAGDDPDLAYFEWSADPDVGPVAQDRKAWADANPGLGIRITEKHIALEQRSMAPRTFAVERLGVGDWFTDDGLGDALDFAAWTECRDLDSRIDGHLTLAFDTNPERSATAIAAAGRRADGVLHVEFVDYRPGTGWVVERLKQLATQHQPDVIACDRASPAASLIQDLEAVEVQVETVSATDLARACGALFDAVTNGQVRHLGQAELDAAVRGASRRPLAGGDAWAWSRKNSSVDISPLVAATVALWHAPAHAPPPLFAAF